MLSVSAFERQVIVDTRGRQLGRVSAVLFHPTEPRVVGLQVDRSAVLGVIEQRPRYVRLDEISITDEGVLALDADTLPRDAAGERVLGYTWDETVIWRRMPVRGPSGESVGHVHDVTFDHVDGAVGVLRVSTGAVGDAALGRRDVPATLLRGFDGEAVVLEAGYADIDTTGGAAKTAAAGVTAIKERSGQVADGVLEVGVAAAGALGRSLKSGTGRKIINKVKSFMDDGE